jgi:hypothetical protein
MTLSSAIEANDLRVKRPSLDLSACSPVVLALPSCPPSGLVEIDAPRELPSPSVLLTYSCWPILAASSEYRMTAPEPGLYIPVAHSSLSSCR